MDLLPSYERPFNGLRIQEMECQKCGIRVLHTDVACRTRQAENLLRTQGFCRCEPDDLPLYRMAGVEIREEFTRYSGGKYADTENWIPKGASEAKFMLRGGHYTQYTDIVWVDRLTDLARLIRQRGERDLFPLTDPISAATYLKAGVTLHAACKCWIKFLPGQRILAPRCEIGGIDLRKPAPRRARDWKPGYKITSPEIQSAIAAAYLLGRRVPHCWWKIVTCVEAFNRVQSSGGEST